MSTVLHQNILNADLGMFFLHFLHFQLLSPLDLLYSLQHVRLKLQGHKSHQQTGSS